jgi:hypothetical protein
MKQQFLSFCAYCFLIFFCPLLTAQQSGIDSTGMPGDQFSLQGALAAFQEAASPEAFEKALNTESNHVNNLDLNGDGDIDYIRVVDQMDGNVHAIILQVPVSENEIQDVAVIEIEKTGDTTAVLQIIGDEELYGEQVIVEPNGEVEPEVLEKKGKGPAPTVLHSPAYIVVNVWGWPCVRFVYAPAYRPWVSPWRWRHYPVWWRPWRPLGWHVWRPYHHHYHRHFTVVKTHRVVHAHKIYTPVRRTSVTVHKRHSASVGHWKVNRHKATVTGPRGGKTTVTRTTVRGPKGKVRGTKTTVKRRRG